MLTAVLIPEKAAVLMIVMEMEIVSMEDVRATGDIGDLIVQSPLAPRTAQIVELALSGMPHSVAQTVFVKKDGVVQLVTRSFVSVHRAIQKFALEMGNAMEQQDSAHARRDFLVKTALRETVSWAI